MDQILLNLPEDEAKKQHTITSPMGTKNSITTVSANVEVVPNRLRKNNNTNAIQLPNAQKRAYLEIYRKAHK